MSMTDPVADFLTRVRNAIQASHETVEIPASKLKIEMARILREQGYINAYELEALGMPFSRENRPAFAQDQTAEAA